MDDERLREEDRQQFITSLDVYDSEWDVETYADIGDFGMGTRGELIITDHEQRTTCIYAPGSWHRVEVSREARIDSTNDEETTDGETDDTADGERDT